MKTDTHPTYNDNVVVTCACGATHPIGSTLEELKVEICSECHPFYTGNEKIMDTAGRVDKFKKRMEQATVKAPKKATPAPEVKEEKTEEAPVAEEVKEEVVEAVVEETPVTEEATEVAAEGETKEEEA